MMLVGHTLQNPPVVLTSVEDALKERPLQVGSFEEVRSWKCPGRLSCAVFCKMFQKKPTLKSCQGPGFPP